MTAMNTQFPAEPMAAFYAAVAAVENGQVGEVELMFTVETDSTSMGPGQAVSMSIEIRKYPNPPSSHPAIIVEVEQKDE